jgi:hypothetical protein
LILPPSDVLGKQTCLCGISSEIQTKIREGSTSRSYVEAKRRDLEVIGSDGEALKVLTECAAECYVRFVEKQMDEMRKDNQKMMSLLERLVTPKDDSPAVQVGPHSQVTQVPTTEERQRSVCSDCGG